ncbi:MAG: zf-TFIIB domain-containing protein [Gammaproteobacteria bacterium]|nr:zf-TFIIB domain-containing protein [Gammaproteobacteria bacterium]
MKCPKCNEQMERAHSVYADVDRCSGCKGLWLDMLEYKDIKNIANEIDIGDPKVGKEFDKKDDIYCPVCANCKMIKMSDPRQPHIHFESCVTCYGRFYDAGEIKDLAEETLVDFFRDIFARERK